jgi:hypothetical protein
MMTVGACQPGGSTGSPSGSQMMEHSMAPSEGMMESASPGEMMEHSMAPSEGMMESEAP